jgi:N-acetylglucosamine malate deacetylase 2
MGRLATGEGPLFAGLRVMLIAAHPDDETLFASSQLSACRTLCIVHTTDGVTTRRAARNRGFRNRAAYAKARRQELRAALAAGGIVAGDVCLGYRDQTVSYRMRETAVRLRDIFRITRPDVILTHGYEGGHLDHDATCYAVHQAVRSLAKPVPIWEFAGYHVQQGQVGRNAFPADGRSSVTSIELNSTQREAKRKMLDCFVTQRDVVANFLLSFEAFRPAPAYDFSQPPFAGKLGYEISPDNSEGKFWRSVACAEAKFLNDAGYRSSGSRYAKLRLWMSFKISRLKRRFTFIQNFV